MQAPHFVNLFRFTVIFFASWDKLRDPRANSETKIEYMYATFFAEKNQKRRGHFVCHVAKVVGDLVAKLGQHSHVGSLIGAKKKGTAVHSFPIWAKGKKS